MRSDDTSDDCDRCGLRMEQTLAAYTQHALVCNGLPYSEVPDKKLMKICKWCAGWYPVARNRLGEPCSREKSIYNLHACFQDKAYDERNRRRNEKVPTFKRFTFTDEVDTKGQRTGRQCIVRSIHADPDHSDHMAFHENVKRFKTLMDKANQEEQHKWEDSTQKWHDFNYSKGTFEWGCPYCGGFEHACLCVSNQ